MLLVAGVLFGLFALVLYIFYSKPEPDAIPYNPTLGGFGDDGGETKGDSGESEEGEEVILYFGSQTGTAEEFAETLAEEVPKGKFKCTVIDLEDFDEDEFLEQKLVIFFMATHVLAAMCWLT